MGDAKNLNAYSDLIPDYEDLREVPKMASSLLMNSKGALFWTTHLRASFKLLSLCSVGIITRNTKTKVIIYINTQGFLNIRVITDGVIADF